MKEDRIEGRMDGESARRLDAGPLTAVNELARPASAGMVSGRSAAPPGASQSPPVSPHAARGRSAAPLSQADVGALIEQNYVGLRLLVARRCRDPQVAADLLNDAVCTTWAKWQAGKIERPEQIAGYVLQVTMNLLRNHRRAIAERPEKRADAAKLQDLASDTEPSDETIEREIAVQVKNVIRGMSSQRDRAILVRFYLDEEDKETICRDLGLSPLQFDKILHRARGRLRKLLESGGLGRSDLLCLCPFL
ncbi:MAG TPA: sigma-70 family RNA polymerase sigma factor [Steroidobacteraceae bacterium]|nr:sigma-70 family RNA polymerase sigma factor [Steroidobacteraceae bacterium]